MNSRERLLRKARNIKKNNLEARWKGETLSREIAHRVIKKFHAFQAFRNRERARHLALLQAKARRG